MQDSVGTFLNSLHRYPLLTREQEIELSRQVIDAVFFAVNKCIWQFTSLPACHLHYTVTSAQGIPGPVEVEIGLLYLNKIFLGTKSGDSTIRCTTEAYIQAMNRVIRYSQATGR